MKNRVAAIFAMFIVPAGFGLSRAADQDVKGASDHPLLSRMPGFPLCRGVY